MSNANNAADAGAPLLELRGVSKEFHVPGHRVPLSAVSDVSFSVHEGETLGLVGESGCGKSTTARVIIQAPRPTRGEVLLRGVNMTALHGQSLRKARREVQMVFQDPYSSLDPRWKVRDLVAEPLRVNHMGTRTERAARVDELLSVVGLDPKQYGDRKPGNLSGGQAQRVGIARALALSPSLVICDEAVSSLDVSIRAQILNLLEDLRQELGLTYLFIAHDLTVVKHVSDWVGVMYLGRLCEHGRSDVIYRSPAHPYTASLLAAVSETATAPDRSDAGEIPSPFNPPSGCRFRTRCPYAQERCAEEVPELRILSAGHRVACHFPLATS